MDTAPVIFDIGSYSCKVGFAGEKTPKKFLSIVGTPSRSIQNDMNFTKTKKVVVGQKLRSGIHDLSYPIRNGEIKEWDDLQTLFEHGFVALGKEDLRDTSIVLTDSIFPQESTRKRLAQIMFETYNASYFYIENQPFFSLFAKPEKSAGIVLEIGDGLTQIFPCIGGYALRKGMRKIPFAGESITNDLVQDFSNTEIGNKSHLKDIAQIKARYCRVALDYEKELNDLKPIGFPLKNMEFTLGEGQIRAPEKLFRPNGASEIEGIHELLNEAILNCDQQFHGFLYQNIIISGGTAGFPGFAERLEKEMKLLAPDQTIRVSALPDPSESAFRGASKFARFPKAFNSRFAISSDEYEEDDNVVAQKCFSFKL